MKSLQNWVPFLLIFVLQILFNTTSYLSTGSCYFVYNIGEHNILIVSTATHFLPLGILT